MTRQRIAILACLSKHPGHYTASEIFALAKEEYPALSRATVYNALPVLVAEGKLKKIIADGTIAIYDTTVCTHAHVVCPVCGEWKDVFLPAVTQAVADTFGDTTPYTLTVECVCENCKNNK